jgi:hypothetical protein
MIAIFRSRHHGISSNSGPRLVRRDLVAAGKLDPLLHVVHIEIADPVMADLAVAQQPPKAGERISQGHRAAPVQEVEIDVVGLEPLQTALAGFDDTVPRSVVGQHLADDEEAVAQPARGLGNDLLGGAIAVHFRGVDQGQAELDSEPDRRRLFLRAAAVLAHVPSALAEGRHLLAVRQRHLGQSVGHRCSPVAAPRSSTTPRRRKTSRAAP